MDQKLIDLIAMSKKMKRVGSIKRHPDYQLIVEQTSFLPTFASVSQRIWHIINNVSAVPVCSVCNNRPVSWRKDKGGFYSKTCSNSCATKDSTRTQKIQGTNLEKYGCVSPFGSKEVQQKSQQTVKLKYNVENVSQLDCVKQKKVQTTLANYNVKHHMQNPVVLEKMQQTNVIKYGARNVGSNEQIKNKIRSSMFSRFGRSFPNQTHIPAETIKCLNDRDWLYEHHIVQKKTLQKIASDLNINETTVGKYLHMHGLETQMFFCSSGEKEIREYIESFDINVVCNTRAIIPPYEIDIYIPEHNLAIEYCGLFWHSEQCGKDRSYHKNKFDSCLKQGIRLLTIFEDEWIFRMAVCKSKISQALGKTHNRIFARRTTCISLSPHERHEFLEAHHIQGNVGSKLSYGLVQNGELVALMTFIQQSSTRFLLSRYATSCSVVGGFTKILKHFQRTNRWTEILTFADLRWDTGKTYINSGFVFDKMLPPDYSYSLDGHHRSHKFNYRRKNLSKMFGTKFNPQESEKTNCDNNGVLRIWDCGKIRYKLTNPQQQ